MAFAQRWANGLGTARPLIALRRFGSNLGLSRIYPQSSGILA